MGLGSWRTVRPVAAAVAWGCLVVAAVRPISSAQPPLAPNSADFDAVLKQGFALHQAAQYAAAIKVLEQARRMEPGDYFANLLLGIDLLRSGKAAEAVPRLRVAAKAKPEEEFPMDYLGEAEAALGENALAAEAYRQALLRGHDSEAGLEAWAGFALERFRQIGEQLRSSQEGLAVAKRLQGANWSANAGAGCAEEIPGLERRMAAKPAAGRWQKFAANQTGSLAGNHPGTALQAAYRLSICYAVEAGSAEESLRNASEDMAAVYRLRGDVLLRLKGDGAGAAAEYKRAIECKRGQPDPALLERLAEAQSMAGELDAAKESARAALAIDPHRRGAQRTLATLALADREYAEAVPLLRELAVATPGDRGVAVELGRALAETGETAQALKWLAGALATGYPDDKGASHALLARLLRKQGRDAEAGKAEAEARRLSDSYQSRDHASESGGTVGEKVPDAIH